MAHCTFDPSGFFAHVFGSWPNATQGVFGAFVGVVGAYGVAVWTTRKELRRDRERAREEQGIAAAGQLTRALIGLPLRIERIENAEWTSDRGIESKILPLWEKECAVVVSEVTEHGTLLPMQLESDALAMTGLLRSVIYAEFDDEHGGLVLVEAGKVEDLSAAKGAIEQLLKGLQEYRRDPTAARWKQENQAVERGKR